MRLAELVPVDELPPPGRGRPQGGGINWTASLVSIAGRGWHRVDEEMDGTWLYHVATRDKEMYQAEIAKRGDGWFVRVEALQVP